MKFPTVEEAIVELKKHPERPVQAHCGDLDVELRAITRPAAARRLGDSLAALGPWEGESTEELMNRLREARKAGGSAEPPAL